MKDRDKDCDVDVSYKKDKIILKRMVKTNAVYQIPDMATKIKQRTFLLYSNILGINSSLNNVKGSRIIS